MRENVEIERLEHSDKQELLDLLTQAFKDYPFIPANAAKPEATRAVMNAFLDFFGGTKGSLLYGIREDNKLICAALSLDSTIQPSILALMRFTISLFWALGRRALKEHEVVKREEPKYQERYLDLVILGTLPAYQRQGFGRKMLNFLYNEAKRENYNGVILLAHPNWPAFHLYLKEGFVVDKEFTIGETALCWMRLVF